MFGSNPLLQSFQEGRAQRQEGLDALHAGLDRRVRNQNANREAEEEEKGVDEDEKHEDEEEIPEVVFTGTGRRARAGAEFRTDIYDFPHERHTAAELYHVFANCLRETYDRHHLLPSTLMFLEIEGYRIDAAGGAGDRSIAQVFMSSKALGYQGNLNWLRTNVEGGDHHGESDDYRKISIVTRLYVNYVDPPAGNGLDVKLPSVWPTHSHNTELCAAISLTLLAAKFVLHKKRKFAKAMSNLTGKALEAKLKENTQFALELKEWACMSKHEKAAKPKSKTCLMRIEKAKDLHISADLKLGDRVENAGLAAMVDVLSQRLQTRCGVIVFWENRAMMFSHPQDATQVDHWFHLLKTTTNHYQAIDSVQSFKDSNMPYCNFCKASRDAKHKCRKACDSCKGSVDHGAIITAAKEADPLYEHKFVSCYTCKMKCVNVECLTKHEKKCGKYWKCPVCGGNYETKKLAIADHRCSDNPNEIEMECQNCQEMVLPWPLHLCYIKRKPGKGLMAKVERRRVQPDGTVKMVMLDKVLYADIESTQDVEVKNADSECVVKPHVANLICTMEQDGEKWPAFQTIGEWLDKLSNGEEWDGYTVVFHNASGYDSHFIGSEFLARKLPTRPQMAGGTRIRELSFCTSSELDAPRANIRIIDSAMFICTKLAEFPKTFGLKDAAGKKSKKGEYCHFANLSVGNNWTKPLGKIPLEAFGCEMMPKDQRKDFLEWYTKNAEYVWDNEKELLEYCWQDVDLLRRGCECFRKIYIEKTTCSLRDGSKPETESEAKEKMAAALLIECADPPATLAAIEDAIGDKQRNPWLAAAVVNAQATRDFVIPMDDDYIRDDADLTASEQSVKAEEHAVKAEEKDEEEERFKAMCQNVKNEIDVKAEEEDEKEICKIMAKERAKAEELFRKLRTPIDPFRKSTMASVAKSVYCAQYMPENTIAALPRWLVKALTPAARGGRTDLHHLYWKAKHGQKGYYFDFTSLYPWVNRFGRYPVGHPRVCFDIPVGLLDSAEKCANFLRDTPGLGVLWCDIVCPQKLRHPVLPMLRDGKLMFDLMDRGYPNWKGTDMLKANPVTSLELIEAVAQGYIVTKIHGYTWWVRETIGIFGDFVNTFFKMKTQADSWPSENMTDEQKAKFAADFKEAMGVDLEIDKVAPVKNEGIRSVAKFSLNSLWGKWGERLDYNSAHVLYDDNPSNEKWRTMTMHKSVDSWSIINEECVIVNQLPKAQKDNNVVFDKNISLAIFTTAQARLKLLKEFLMPLDYRVLYYDTDSVVFFTEANETPDTVGLPPLGTLLGQPTSEIGAKSKWGVSDTGAPCHIVEFFSGGPKNYGYMLVDNGVHFKCKGLPCKRSDVLNQLTYEKAKEAVLNGYEIMLTIPSCIRRSKVFSIHSTIVNKVYRETWTKGNILEHKRFEDGTLQSITTEPWKNATRKQYEALVSHLKETPTAEEQILHISRLKTGHADLISRLKPGEVCPVFKPTLKLRRSRPKNGMRSFMFEKALSGKPEVVAKIVSVGVSNKRKQDHLNSVNNTMFEDVFKKIKK